MAALIKEREIRFCFLMTEVIFCDFRGVPTRPQSSTPNCNLPLLWCEWVKGLKCLPSLLAPSLYLELRPQEGLCGARWISWFLYHLFSSLTLLQGPAIWVLQSKQEGKRHCQRESVWAWRWFGYSTSSSVYLLDLPGKQTQGSVSSQFRFFEVLLEAISSSSVSVYLQCRQNKIRSLSIKPVILIYFRKK